VNWLAAARISRVRDGDSRHEVPRSGTEKDV